MRVITPTVLMAFLILGAAGCGQLRPDESNGAIALCEKQLLSSLKAPSTYKRISADFRLDDPFTLSEFKKFELTSFCGAGDHWFSCTDTNEALAALGMKQLSDSKGLKHPNSKKREEIKKLYWEKMFAEFSRRPLEQRRPATVILSYDAQNAFGTPIRESTVCKFGGRVHDKYSMGDMYLGSLVDGEI